MQRHNDSTEPRPLLPRDGWFGLVLIASLAVTRIALADGTLSQDKKIEGKNRAEAKIVKVAPPALSLTGRWQMTLPAGFKRVMTFKPEGKNRFRFLGRATAMTGLFEIKGRRLVVIKPDDRRLTEYQWEIVDADTLKLVVSPPVRKIGSDYTGAILKRQKEGAK